jgi:hypothetical protein
MSVELDVVSKVHVSLPVAVAKSRAPNHFGNIANYAHSGEVIQTHTLVFTYRYHIDWVINSEEHVTGESHSFITYTSYAHLETIQIVDGTSQPIHGVWSVEYTSSINLSSVLHVPSFSDSLCEFNY